MILPSSTPLSPEQRLSEIRALVNEQYALNGRDVADLLAYIDHLTTERNRLGMALEDQKQETSIALAKLAAAQAFTPREIERLAPAGFGIMGPLSEGSYVRHSDHLDSLSQVRTALNLTTYLLEETKQELAKVEAELGGKRG